MSFLPQRLAFRASTLRPVFSAAPRFHLQTRLASQDYGSGKGDPVGENPQQQGKNPSENLEHPGPPPPKVGQGKSPSPNEKSGGQAQQSGGESSGTGEAGSGGKGSAQQSGSNDGTSVKGAQPKILNANPPAEEDESVRQHNREMDQRAEKAHEQVSNEDAEKDKVPASFWKGECACWTDHGEMRLTTTVGQGGRDSNP
jgi:hypothetical protein